MEKHIIGVISEEKKKEVTECLNSVTTGEVFYMMFNYDRPCNVELIEPTDQLFAGLEQILSAYDQICSPDVSYVLAS